MKIFESLITHAFTYYQQIYFDIESELTLFNSHNYNCHSKKFPLCQSEKFV